jgi:hypothetical protein
MKIRLPSTLTVAQVGFQTHEAMTGTHEFVGRAGPAGEFPFSFELDWGTDRLVEFLNPLSKVAPFRAKAIGVIRIGELVDACPCEGTLEFRYCTESKIRYRLAFTVGGRPYEHVGEKVGIRPWNLARTHTTCYGVTYDLEIGKEISRSLCFFRLRTLPSFLRSFHLTFS